MAKSYREMRHEQGTLATSVFELPPDLNSMQYNSENSFPLITQVYQMFS